MEGTFPIDVDADTSNIGDAREANEQPMELDDVLIATLKDLLVKFGMEEMPNRRQELIRAREARYFWRGYQYPMFNSDQSTWIVPQEGGLPYSTTSNADGGDSRFYYVENFYTSLGKSLISALCGTPPEVIFLPQDPKDIDDINASKEANKYKGIFFYNVDIGQVLKDTSRYFWTDGRTIAWVKSETDPKYGYDQEGNPKTQEIVDIGGVLEWKVPITARSKSNFHYAINFTEISVAQAKDKWKDKEAKLKPGMAGPASDQFDRLCRLATLQGTDSMYSGDTYAHLITISNCWIRPCSWMLVKDETKRAQLQQMFPRGVRVTFAGNEFMEATPESMDDVIEVCLPQPGDGQAVASLGEFVIPIQKMHNNKRNLVQEAWEKGTPLKFTDSKAIDEQGLKDQNASPENYLPIKNPYPGQPLENCFYKEQQPVQPADLIASLEHDMVMSQTVAGVQPALFGAPMQNAKTAAVYQQARDQALGSLSITYGPLKTYLAGVTFKAVTIAEERDEDINEMTPDARTGNYMDTSVSIDKLKAGQYKCRAVIDDGGIPESPSAQRQGFQQIIQFLGQDPKFQETIHHPDNQYFLKSITGLRGFEVPGADSRNKQLKEIEDLLQGEVTMPDQEDIEKVAKHDTLMQVAGGSSTNPQPQDLMQSSIPVDPDVDNHEVEMAECLRWLNSDDGQQAKQFNNKGYLNVRQHMMEHKRALTMGSEAAVPLQDRIPNPAVAESAAAAGNAMAAHAQAGMAQAGMDANAAGAPPEAQGGPPTAPGQQQ